MDTLLRDTFRQGHRRSGSLEGIEAGPQLGEPRAVEPGSDAAGIAQFPGRVVIAEQQGAEAVPAALGVGKADDDELLAVEAFDLQPIGAAAGPIGLVTPLGDRAFEIVLAGLAVELVAVPLLMIAVADHPGRAMRHNLGERLLAVCE